eukprot:GHVN01050490.1.p2 GENE.GHVN01050490.1~~GHVN01050490.1.p2  ORF type:complete len:460 (-),score=68.11 GHVN01050490.1:4416-5795(-)
MASPSYFAMESEAGDARSLNQNIHGEVPLPLLPVNSVSVSDEDNRGRRDVGGLFRFHQEITKNRAWMILAGLCASFLFLVGLLRSSGEESVPASPQSGGVVSQSEDVGFDMREKAKEHLRGKLREVGMKHLEKGRDICANPDYRDTTLKPIYEQTFLALWEDTRGELKFEASDVIVVNNTLYIVFDNSWAVGRVDIDLHPYSAVNQQIGDAVIAGTKEDSQWEAILYDDHAHTFWVTREAVSHEDHFHATMSELTLDDSHRSYRTERDCDVEFLFTAGNKGFEGMVGLRDEHGALHMIGLCEGNHCAGGKKGQDAGNGRMVIMSFDGKGESCTWKTTKVVNVPKWVKFVDYSAVAVRGKQIAITSQESSQLFIGEMEGVTDEGVIDVAKFAIVDNEKDAKIYNFPRDDNCNVIYCNIEGIHWINDHLLVAVSDKMKGGGRQSFRCLTKDQSVHIFSLPK